MNRFKFTALIAAGAALALAPTYVAAQDGPPIQLKRHSEGAEVTVLRGRALDLGLKIGDIVMEVGGKAISPQVLQEYMEGKKEGDPVSFKVKRAGTIVEVAGKTPPSEG